MILCEMVKMMRKIMRMVDLDLEWRPPRSKRLKWILGKRPQDLKTKLKYQTKKREENAQ